MARGQSGAQEMWAFVIIGGIVVVCVVLGLAFEFVKAYVWASAFSSAVR